ncbi:MAG TPA: hypothetical protein VFU15_09840, partial [Bacteroidia bacterium]|nr:hypothetical protein [Bacteroidia bacterium]
LILRCLAVQSDEDYRDVEELCRKVTRQTRTSRKPFAQVDFHFTDQDGNAVSDYLFKLGYLQNEKKFPADFVACTHKNEVAPENFNAFLAMEDFESHRDYFFELDATSGSDLFSLQPDILTANAGGDSVSQLIVEDHTTQFEIVLYREPVRNLFVFHAGNDPDLHLRYDRLGVPKKGETGIKPE